MLMTSSLVNPISSTLSSPSGIYSVCSPGVQAAYMAAVGLTSSAGFPHSAMQGIAQPAMQGMSHPVVQGISQPVTHGMWSQPEPVQVQQATAKRKLTHFEIVAFIRHVVGPNHIYVIYRV